MNEDSNRLDALVQPTLKVRQIVSGPNYRENYDAAAMAELEDGLRAAGGVTQAILVRPHPTQEGVWEIIAGERRWRAARKVFGDDYDMPIIVREATDAEARALGIIENHGRDNPSAVEEAKGAADLLQYNAGDKETTAKQLGWSVETLERRLLLLNCAPEVQAAIVARLANVKLGHAELLAGLPKDMQVKVLAGIIEHKVPVEVIKKQLGQFARQLSDAIFDTSACVGCPHNSAQQAALFSESIGEGYCQHPTHYEELTMAALELRAEPLRERFQVVKFIKVGDGFTPLPVTADGPVGVGAEQMESCKGCASYGCSVSAIAGSYGEVTESLCFDAACNSKKVAARRQAERAAAEAAKGAGKKPGGAASAAKSSATLTNGNGAEAERPKNQVPGKVVAFRVEFWRKTVANQLMAQAERNQRVLAALVLAREVRAVDQDRYRDVAAKVAGFKKGSELDAPLRKVLEQADAFDGAKLDTLVKAVAAAAAYGIDTDGLETLLNYLEVDESRHFTLNEAYLSLLTVSELESLADEVGLKKAMGERFAKSKAGKRADFIQALLAVEGFVYAGTVPKAMRYQRRKFKYGERLGEVASAGTKEPAPGATRESQTAKAPAAAEA